MYIPIPPTTRIIHTAPAGVSEVDVTFPRDFETYVLDNIVWPPRSPSLSGMQSLRRREFEKQIKKSKETICAGVHVHRDMTNRVEIILLDLPYLPYRTSFSSSMAELSRISRNIPVFCGGCFFSGSDSNSLADLCFQTLYIFRVAVHLCLALTNL